MDGACHAELDRLLEAALREDLNDLGDITTQLTIPAKDAKAIVIAKSDGAVCGLNAMRLTYARLDRNVAVHFLREDGDKVSRGDKIAEIAGPAESLLTGERVALNFLQRLSGIATLTNKFVVQLAGTPATLFDTRKTTPGWRHLEKYAVRCGGGSNHRFGLYDMFLIKENHLAASGGIEVAVKRCREYVENLERNFLIEVETRNLQEVEQALNAGADRIMLDNMNLEQIKAAVELVNHRVPLEVSGNVNLQSVAAIAATGVEFISTGAITHSAPAMDFSMLFEETVKKDPANENI
jgi:nicotinate-nucleotide pyrophosphorylase (carboxylating)